MTDREAMKMALDVIIELYNDRGEKCEQNKELFVVADKVIAALEAALAQPEQEAGKCGCGANLYINEDGKPCSKVFAQPEQEPVAWMTNSEHEYSLEYKFNWLKTPLHDIPLYTAPPKREWVGLTEEERNEMIGRIQHDQYTRQRDLIGKTQIITEMYLKEKNGG